MAKKKTHSELLGYYYIMFQSTFNNYVKCWIDGSETYTFLTPEKFYKLFDTSESPSNLKMKARHCLDTTSIYYWDIDGETINMVVLDNEPSDLGERISAMSPFKQKSKFTF